MGERFYRSELPKYELPEVEDLPKKRVESKPLLIEISTLKAELNLAVTTAFYYLQQLLDPDSVVQNYILETESKLGAFCKIIEECENGEILDSRVLKESVS